jgi:Putative DNA-binding domain
MKLADLQAAVQNCILTGAAIKPLIKPPPDKECGKAIGVYQYAYFSRLTEFLRHDYAKVHAYLGDDLFAATARAYAEAHPSRHANARWFGQAFPEFLKADPKLCSYGVVHELAALERALNDAFDSADAPIMTMADLAMQNPETFGSLCFEINPSVRTVRLLYNTTSLWSALACEEEPPPPFLLTEPAEVKVWRQGGASRFRLFGAEEGMALSAAKSGVPFQVICEMLAMNNGDETVALTAATYLRGWIEAEAVSGFKAGAS